MNVNRRILFRVQSVILRSIGAALLRFSQFEVNHTDIATKEKGEKTILKGWLILCPFLFDH